MGLVKNWIAWPAWVGGAVLLLCVGLATAAPTGADWRRGVRLLLVEEAGCHYCRVWEEEVGAAYHMTREGRFAPLVRLHVNDVRVDGLAPVNFTPTFVLVRDGREIGRLTGYISEDFFWGMLTPLLEKQGLGTEEARGKG